MGRDELTASVVSGIVSALELALGLATEAPRCGAGALAACCCTTRERRITDATGKNTIIQRIFMNEPLLSLWRGIIPQAVEYRHPANAPARVPTEKFIQIILREPGAHRLRNSLLADDTGVLSGQLLTYENHTLILHARRTRNRIAGRHCFGPC